MNVETLLAVDTSDQGIMVRETRISYLDTVIGLLASVTPAKCKLAGYY